MRGSRPVDLSRVSGAERPAQPAKAGEHARQREAANDRAYGAPQLWFGRGGRSRRSGPIQTLDPASGGQGTNRSAHGTSPVDGAQAQAGRVTGDMTVERFAAEVLPHALTQSRASQPALASMADDEETAFQLRVARQLERGSSSGRTW